MASKKSIVALAGAGLLCALSASAQAPPAVPEATTAQAVSGGACFAAAGTPVDLEIVDPISSATAARGASFRIALAGPLRIDGIEVLPAGAPGRGEVIHAERSRGGGKPGELLLAARTLDHGGAQVALRGMKLGGRGDDRIQGALAASFALGPFAHFIRGSEIEIPAGTRAHARLSAEVPCPASAASMLPLDAPPTIPPDAGDDASPDISSQPSQED